VILKLAVSSDGKAGLAGRKPVNITGSAARIRVHHMRASSDAVVTGIGTVLSDDPLLTCRLPGMADRSPVRVVLDGDLRLPQTSQLIWTARQVPLWVACGETAPRDRESALAARGVEVMRVPQAGGKLDLLAVLKQLAQRRITRVMVEAGPMVASAFLTADLVDEAVLFRSPNAIGADGIDALEGMPLDALSASPKLRLLATEQAGPDAIEHFERV
jgi:diaminohydroxyphosphoribosylaminopyrimidine deaminase/5-amino-6-(5-phosphoribosylamino)uracil reductase